MDEDAKPLPKDFDMDKFLNTSMRMFASETTKVTLICNNSVMDAIIDRFGEDVEAYAYDNIDVSDTATFVWEIK